MAFVHSSAARRDGLGKGDRVSGARVLSHIVDLRRISPLFFIPPEPYPARSARHLPHAGKALCRGYRFPHPTSAPSGHLLPEEGGSVHASPFPWKGLPSAARRGWLSLLAAKPPPLCLSLEGKAVCRKYRFPHPTSAPSGHLLPEEGGSVHASPFPWKGLPSAARRGWLSLLAAKPPPLCLSLEGNAIKLRKLLAP